MANDRGDFIASWAFHIREVRNWGSVEGAASCVSSSLLLERDAGDSLQEVYFLAGCCGSCL